MLPKWNSMMKYRNAKLAITFQSRVNHDKHHLGTWSLQERH